MDAINRLRMMHARILPATGSSEIPLLLPTVGSRAIVLVQGDYGGVAEILRHLFFPDAVKDLVESVQGIFVKRLV